MVSSTSTGLLTLPLSSGTYQLDSPVVLAPMAGITNAPFRMLCREQGAGLFVSCTPESIENGQDEQQISRPDVPRQG